MGAVCSENESDAGTVQKNTHRRKMKKYKSMHSVDLHEDDFLADAASEEVVDAFKQAVKEMDEGLMMHLDQRFPDLNMLDMLMKGETLLHIAVRQKKRKLVVYCLENGLNPNMRNAKDGDSALHLAVKQKDVRMVSILLCYNADPKQTNNDKDIPLDIAEENSDNDMIELLGARTMDAFAKTFSKNGTFREENVLDMGIDQQITPTSSSLRAMKDQNELKEELEQSMQSFKFLMANSNRSATEALLALDGKRFLITKGWLEKKSSSVPYNWHKRWTILKNSFMLWSEIEVAVGDPKDKAERMKFKHISLLQVDRVEKMDIGTKSRFKVVVSIGDKTKEYLWRCETVEDRNRWVDELNYRVQHAKSVVDYLSDDVVDIF